MLNDMPDESKGKDAFTESDLGRLTAWAEGIREAFRNRILAATENQPLAPIQNENDPIRH